MSKEIKFNIKNIQQYITQRAQKGDKCTDNFNISAIFSIFDKNYDGQISKEEFNSITKEQYEQYTTELKDYNSKNGLKNLSIWSYQKLESFLKNKFKDEDNAITEEEMLAPDMQSSDNAKTKSFFGNYPPGSTKKDADLSGTHGLNEQHDLKDFSQMTESEVRAELAQYNINTDNMTPKQLQNTLRKARIERARFDIGSDQVDGNIGTFVQQDGSRYCSVLAKIETMKPEELAEMYNKEPKINPQTGEKYWEIKFPIDDGTDKVQIITETELKSGTITIDGRSLSDFPQGDMDVTLITMAFVKRFGTHITDNGAWAFQTNNKFRKPNEPEYLDNQYIESLDFSNLPAHTIINTLEPKELDRKGFQTAYLQDQDLSWLSQENRNLAKMGKSFIYNMSDGRKACITAKGIFLSDGTKIAGAHALSVRGFDKEKQEVIIGCNEFGNLSETRIPVELMKFFETGSTSNVAGAQKTPQPEL